jgi:hypothetical protein
MYHYKIGCNSYEGSIFFELKHNDSYSDKELKEILTDALLNTAIQIYDNALKYAEETNTEISDVEDMLEYVSVESLMHSEEFEDLLVNKLKFEKLEHHRELIMFGWSSPFKEELDWKKEVGKEEADMLKTIKEGLEKHKFGRVK